MKRKGKENNKTKEDGQIGKAGHARKERPTERTEEKYAGLREEKERQKEGKAEKQKDRNIGRARGHNEGNE